MNRILSGDNIKVLAVSLLDDQTSQDFFVCQNGSSLIRIQIKNSIFETIPYRTICFIKGEINQSLSTDGTLNVAIDLENSDHRFVSFNPMSLKFDRTRSIQDHLNSLETLPDLSDNKPMLKENDFESLDLFLLQKHSHFLKIIRDELECGDYGNTIPPYIQGDAYQKMFFEHKKRCSLLDSKLNRLPNTVAKTKSKKSVKIRKRNENHRSVTKYTKEKVQLLNNVFICLTLN